LRFTLMNAARELTNKRFLVHGVWASRSATTHVIGVGG
jgi:hypothetical protein